jgi:transcriptional regulator with GAF, ATPase, and Fis domain
MRNNLLSQSVSKELFNASGTDFILGESEVLRQALARIKCVADSGASILLTGETGVGKELFARFIHYCSSRSLKPFVPLNCGALPTTLFESELFGHRRGAFTDARENREGLIHEANCSCGMIRRADARTLSRSGAWREKKPCHDVAFSGDNKA